MNQKLAAFFTTLFPEDYIEIDGDTYHAEDSVENDDESYVLLRNVADPSDTQIRRVYQCYELVEDEAELQNVLHRLEAQKARVKAVSKGRHLAFDIAILVLTVAAIAGNSWLVRYREISVFAHELICYGLLALSFCALNHRLPARKSFATSVLVAFGFAIVFTSFVFLLNNWWRYLHMNTMFYWKYPNSWYCSYGSLLESDFQYKLGIGRFRYWIVFFSAFVGILVDTIFAKKSSKGNNTPA